MVYSTHLSHHSAVFCQHISLIAIINHFRDKKVVVGRTGLGTPGPCGAVTGHSTGGVLMTLYACCVQKLQDQRLLQCWGRRHFSPVQQLYAWRLHAHRIGRLSLNIAPSHQHGACVRSFTLFLRNDAVPVYGRAARHAQPRCSRSRSYHRTRRRAHRSGAGALRTPARVAQSPSSPWRLPSPPHTGHTSKLALLPSCTGTTSPPPPPPRRPPACRPNAARQIARLIAPPGLPPFPFYPPTPRSVRGLGAPAPREPCCARALAARCDRRKM